MPPDRAFVKTRDRSEMLPVWRRAVALALLAVIAGIVLFGLEAVALSFSDIRETVDAQGLRDVLTVAALWLLPLLAMMVVGFVDAIVSTWRRRRDSGWTRLELDASGVTAIQPRDTRRSTRRIIVQLVLGLFAVGAWGTVLVPATLSLRALGPSDPGPTTETALASARRAVQERPRSADAWSSLSQALLAAGSPGEALDAAESGFALGDRPVFTLAPRARALERLGRYREAARDRAGLIPWGSPHVAAADASRLLLQAGDVGRARAMAERAVAFADVPGTRTALERVRAAEAR